MLAQLLLTIDASQNHLSNASSPVKHTNNQSTEKVAGGPASITSKSNSTPAAKPQVKRARLDVGFASFEKDMMEQVLASIRKATDSDHWTQQLQLGCKDNVSQSVSQGLKSVLAPLKLTIGKTWMSLPEDEQKNNYVDTLRSAFDGVFKDVMGTIDTHLQRSLQRLKIHPAGRKVTQDELMAECATSITGNIVSERCYDIGGGQHMKKVSSFLEVPKKASVPKNFCMPSVLEALARRLVDSQGLIGMTMQFESKSLSLSAAPSAIDDIVKQASDLGH